MRAGEAGSCGVRRGEVIAAMSLATDLAMGQPAEFATKSAVLGTRIGTMLGLSPQDVKVLRKLERQKGEFLIKQNQESIALRAGMEGMDDIAAIFSNNIKNLIAAGGEYANLPQVP